MSTLEVEAVKKSKMRAMFVLYSVLPKGKTEMWAGDDDQYTYHEERYVDPHADFLSANE